MCSDKLNKCKYCNSPIQVINKKFCLVECENCFLIFSQLIFSQEELREVYNRLYNDENPQYKIHSIIEYRRLKEGKIKIGYNKNRLLKKYLAEDSKVLEIGSGIGLIGCYIRQNFTNISYKGVEIDTKINEKAKSFGLDVHQGDFTTIENFDKDYDVVLMWEVLEHIQDIKKCISLIHNRLLKGGLFIFSVPNYDKILNYKSVADEIFTSGPPIHLNFFREKSVYEIFESKDFEIVKFKKKKLPYLNLKSLQQMFPKIVLGKYEGSTLYCVARKK